MQIVYTSISASKIEKHEKKSASEIKKIGNNVCTYVRAYVCMYVCMYVSTSI